MSVHPANSQFPVRLNPGKPNVSPSQDEKAVDGARSSESLGLSEAVGTEKTEKENGESLADLPDIREELIEAAKEKLSSGYYHSREAALATARSMLR